MRTAVFRVPLPVDCFAWTLLHSAVFLAGVESLQPIAGRRTVEGLLALPVCQEVIDKDAPAIHRSRKWQEAKGQR
jgi:hypothetical protein